MCELLIDDFSLLNARLEDATITPLGSDSGFDLGNAEAVHNVVDSFLRNDTIVHTDDWSGRQIVLPIKIDGADRAALADMAARVHLAVQHPQKLTLVPCDEWGAPSWWRIQWAALDATTDDSAEQLNHYHAYKITLGVEAWSHSVETYTSTGSNAVAPSVVFDASVSTTGWAAENGTLDVSAGTYVGVNSDGSTATHDTLKNATRAWDPNTGPYTKITVECKVNPGSGGVTVDGGPYPQVQVLGYRGGTWSVVATAVVERTDLGSGWYAETLMLAYALPSFDGIGVIATGGDQSDQDLKVRKITLIAGSTFPGAQGQVFIDVPGSAPCTGDLTVSAIGGGLVVYTAPNLPEVVNGTAEGTYALIGRRATGTVTGVTWSVGTSQSGTLTLSDLPYDATSGWFPIANVYLPDAPGGSTTGVTVGALGGGTIQTLLLWMENPLTGYSAALTIVHTAGGADGGVFKYVAPTPARPAPAYLLNGVQNNDLIRAAGQHRLDPGINRVFVAWAQASSPTSPVITWTGYPSWHTHAVPKSRWRQTP